ncbi:hypothetical protein KUF71_010953, partial [Frankliniella fusca]
MQDLRGDGYFFYEYRQTPTAKYFRCIKFRSRRCPVRAIRRVGQADVSQSGIHSHAPNPSLLLYLRERQILINEARRLDVASFRDIFDARRNNATPYGNLLNHHRLWPALHRARMSVLPAAHDLGDFVQVLDNPLYACVTATNRFSDSVYSGSVETPNGSRVCSIGGQVNNIGKVVRLGWMVMDDLSENTLTVGFSLLRSSLPFCSFTSVLCGDDSVAQSLRTVFSVPVLHSLFDYIQDIKTFIATNTLISLPIICQSQKLREVLNGCCSLPLLPPDVLQLGINIILAEATEFTSFVHSGLHKLFEHITSNWLQHPLKKDTFSITSSDRANYGCEELKLKDSRKFKNNADLYSVTRYVVSQTEKTHSLIGNILRGEDLPVGPVSVIDLEPVRVLTTQLRSPLLAPALAVKNFILVTSQLLQHPRSPKSASPRSPSSAPSTSRLCSSADSSSAIRVVAAGPSGAPGDIAVLGLGVVAVLGAGRTATERMRGSSGVRRRSTARVPGTARARAPVPELFRAPQAQHEHPLSSGAFGQAQRVLVLRCQNSFELSGHSTSTPRAPVPPASSLAVANAVVKSVGRDISSKRRVAGSAMPAKKLSSTSLSSTLGERPTMGSS